VLGEMHPAPPPARLLYRHVEHSIRDDQRSRCRLAGLGLQRSAEGTLDSIRRDAGNGDAADVSAGVEAPAAGGSVAPVQSNEDELLGGNVVQRIGSRASNSHQRDEDGILRAGRVDVYTCSAGKDGEPTKGVPGVVWYAVQVCTDLTPDVGGYRYDIAGKGKVEDSLTDRPGSTDAVVIVGVTSEFEGSDNSPAAQRGDRDGTRYAVERSEPDIGVTASTGTLALGSDPTIDGGTYPQRVGSSPSYVLKGDVDAPGNAAGGLASENQQPAGDSSHGIGCDRDWVRLPGGSVYLGCKARVATAAATTGAGTAATVERR
jgi:hypothetical protein